MLKNLGTRVKAHYWFMLVHFIKACIYYLKSNAIIIMLIIFMLMAIFGVSIVIKMFFDIVCVVILVVCHTLALL